MGAGIPRASWAGATKRQIRGPKVDLWPVYEVPGSTPYSADSDKIVQAMVAVLMANAHDSTTEALALLRQIYPQYPLTLRLAALSAHMKTQKAHEAERSHAALTKLYQELSH